MEDDKGMELVEGLVLVLRGRDVVDDGDAVSDLGKAGS